MNIYDLTTNQLKRAAAIKEQIDRLNKELRSILGAPTKSKALPTKNRAMSASTKKKDRICSKSKMGELSTG
jgi:hypothetical protein